MWAYILRRILLTVPTIFGIVFLTLLLFSFVAKNPARAHAGKQANEATIKAISHKMGIDKPSLLNFKDVKTRGIGAIFDSQFFDLLFFRFHESMRYEQSVWQLVAMKAPVSLAIQVPALIVGLGVELLIAMYAAMNRGRAVDHLLTGIAVVLMSVPALCVYIGLQWLCGAKLPIFPVAGWESGIYSIKFAALPILCAIIVNTGWGARFYRTVVLDEINSDYVRTARAKGVSGRDVLLTHVLRNVMIPLITRTIADLPFILFSSLILEQLFQIPGLGGLLVTSIFNEDRSVVMALTYLTSIAYCVGLLASDILYAMADPRVSLK
jgi:peptide/nickel transport system permease protein